MQTYRVTWAIELDAENPRAAAETALAWLRDPATTAHYFDVINEAGEKTTIRLKE